MSDDYVRKQIKELEKEALQLEARTITIKERAQWDKHHPFSIREYD